MKWPDWLPKKYRKLWNWKGGTDEESNPADTLHESKQTEPKVESNWSDYNESNWSDALAVDLTLEEPTLALLSSFLYCSVILITLMPTALEPLPQTA